MKGQYYVYNLMTGDTYKFKHRDLAEEAASRMDNNYGTLCTEIYKKSKKQHRAIKRTFH